MTAKPEIGTWMQVVDWWGDSREQEKGNGESEPEEEEEAIKGELLCLCPPWVKDFSGAGEALQNRAECASGFSLWRCKCLLSRPLSIASVAQGVLTFPNFRLICKWALRQKNWDQ